MAEKLRSATQVDKRRVARRLRRRRQPEVFATTPGLLGGTCSLHVNALREADNIHKARRFFTGEKSPNQPKILPAVLAKIVDWRGFPGDDRTDC